MKKLLILALCFIVAPTGRVWAQNDAPEIAETKTMPPISVLGEVEKPGNFPFVESEKAISLLERAGGATALSSIGNAYVLRGGVKIPLDLSQSQAAQFVLQAGDVLVVPKNQNRLYVVGNVVRPGSYLFPEQKPMFVLDALALAGGLLSDPAKAKIGIIRSAPNVSIEWHDWPETMEDAFFSIPLQAGDGIYVKRTGPRGPFTGPDFTWPLLPHSSDPVKLLSY